jgi:hypothetical protein
MPKRRKKSYRSKALTTPSSPSKTLILILELKIEVLIFNFGRRVFVLFQMSPLLFFSFMADAMAKEHNNTYQLLLLLKTR